MKHFKRLIATLFIALYASACINAQDIFAVTNYGDIYSIDIATCQCTFVMKVSQVTTFDDIALQGNKLYGLLQGGGTMPGRIFVLDTAAGSTTQIGSAIQYSGNAMTSDKSGNLYLVHNQGSSGDLYRYNIASGTHVLLGTVGETVGDLAFMNDTLYAVCFMGVLKRIILNPFSVGVVGTITLPNPTPYLYGLATIEDGTGLCVSAVGPGMTGPMLYRLDQTTAVGTVLCASLNIPYDHMINGLAYPPTYIEPVVSIGIMNEMPSLEIQPNPVTDYLTISFPSGLNGTYIFSVLTTQGTEVLSYTQDIDASITINIGHLPDGIYILRMHGQGMQMTRRFVKKDM